MNRSMSPQHDETVSPTRDAPAEREAGEDRLPSHLRARLEAFHAEHGRPLRVLHIGNIANNAYNNAKVMRAHGLDCDVVCYDYYHCMSTPEWEDADFKHPPDDDLHPDWSAMGLRAFSRPRWFVQGPIEWCLQYLVARDERDRDKRERYWDQLAWAASLPAAEYCEPGRGNAVTILSTVRHDIGLLAAWLRRTRAKQSRLERWLVRLAKRWFPLGMGVSLGLAACMAIPLTVLALATGFGMIAAAPFVLPLRAMVWLIWTRQGRFADRVNALVREFARQFPDRTDHMVASDFFRYRRMYHLWRNVMRRYEIVQGYSTDPILPLVAEKPYFAFEHGTLRDIPDEQTQRGRICSLGYRMAEHVFVTNIDCMDNAHRLAGDRVSFINHPYDEDACLAVTGVQALRDQLTSELRADFLFFFPTRQDWVADTGYADKANDVFLRAFIRLLEKGHHVGMVCCRWGRNVDQSVSLLSACADKVRWVEPMGLVQFNRMVQACDVVIDQFKLGAFGGVTFKALANRGAVCTYLDEAAVASRYPEPPPVINCRTTAQIVEQMCRYIDDRSRLVDLGDLARAWIKRYHRSVDGVALQLEQYFRLLDRHRPESR